jgi:hypothetical protein
MPACVTFNPGTRLFGSAKYDTTLFDSSHGMRFLDPKRLTAAFFSLQNQQQLLTPPSSPKPVKWSPFDEVPYEILDQILGLVHGDTSRRIYEVLRDISGCCLVSRQFHAVAINWLYRHVPISDPYAFTKVRFRVEKLADWTVFDTNQTPSGEGFVG